MFSKLSNKIMKVGLAAVIVLFLIVGVASAVGVKPGDTVSFTIRNSAESEGAMEGVSVSDVSTPSFVSLVQEPPSSIPPGGSGEVAFEVKCADGNPGGTISFTLTHETGANCSDCTPEKWSPSMSIELENCDDGDECTKDQCDTATGRCQHIPVKLTRCQVCENGQIKARDCGQGSDCTIQYCDPEKGCQTRVLEKCDRDNSDPTYLQYPRGGGMLPTDEPLYQFSPTGSHRSKDILDIDYALENESLVSFLIYDAEGNLVRTLLDSVLRDEGENIEAWDGRDENGNLVSDGRYSFIITGVNLTDASDAWDISDEILIDNVAPTATIGFVKADTPALGHYTVAGTAGDEHFSMYMVEWLRDDAVVNAAYFYFPVEKDDLASFDTSDMEEGLYSIRLTVTDFAGNATTDETPLMLKKDSGEVKIHVNTLSQSIISGTEGYSPASDDTTIWIDDELPQGATEMDAWEWNSEITYSGLQSHTDPADEGAHGHYFIHADTTLILSPEENLIQYVFLDPEDPPRQILLQFYTDDGDGEHRAYWGESLIPTDGQDGTVSLYPMGWLPETGKWIRLRIPSSTVGLGGKEIKGMAFVIFGGRVYWDKTTKSLSHIETQKNSWLSASQVGSEERLETEISYSLSQGAIITLSIFDEENTLVRTVMDEYREAGTHEVTWDALDDQGNPVESGKYDFQFAASGKVIDSNAYAPIPGNWSGISPVTTITDSAGNRHEISYNAVNTYDASGELLYAISENEWDMERFNPTALALDENDNLFILTGESRIFKLNPVGHCLTELPYPNDLSWANVSFDSPNAISSDGEGNLFVANQYGNETIKLGVGRGQINLSGITANIRIPYQNSLVYATVPIIGDVAAVGFDHYTVEYGTGDSPSEWTLLTSSVSEVFDKHTPLPQGPPIWGNLATWQVNTSIPMGPYTVRLTVYDHQGNSKEERVNFEVARVVRRSASTITTHDGRVTLELPNGAISDDADLFSIKPVTDPPTVTDPWLTLVGQAYQIKPEGYPFLKPCTLTMLYDEADLGSINENTLKVYRWNPVIERWIYVYADLNTEKNILLTTLTGFNDYEVFYAIFSDPPPAPVIYAPASPTNLRYLTVHGKASPSVKVEIYANDMSRGMVQANENTGNFSIEHIRLNEGNNTLTARAVDPLGNTSSPSTPVSVELSLGQPAAVDSVSFMTEDFSSDFTDEVTVGDSVHIELTGTDTDPGSVNSALVHLKSNAGDGISVQLLETDIDSGIYRGTARVSDIDDEITGEVNTSFSEAKTLTVIAAVSPSKQDILNVKDIIPPPAPVNIRSATHPSLCQNTFETNLDEWANMSGTFGADVTRSDEAAASGDHSAKLVNAEEGGDFAAYIRKTPFDPRQYPMISFDYKIPHHLRVNLVAYVNGMWKEIVFTDEPKRAETFKEDLYRTIGYVEEVLADNQWHHAEFNLYNLLKKDDPEQEEYIVEEMFFVDYNLPGWMELVMGEQNPQGTTYHIDNFIISEGGKTNNSPEFTWQTDDASVVGYSHVLDQNPGTLPPETDKGDANNAAYTDVGDGVWYFHVRSVDGGGNWGPANHYQIKIDASGPVAHSPVPENGSSWGNMEIQLGITDGEGSGVDPDTIEIEVNSVTYAMDSGGISYDEETGVMTFSLWKVIPEQEPWPDASTVQASLTAANDFAGNPLESVFSWTWTVDYSELAGGYLSLLTAKGGFTPTWSPDGTKIAFMSERNKDPNVLQKGDQNIWIIDADDFAETRGTAELLTSHEADDHHPAWSPADDRIAFTSDRDGVEHIYLIHADGTGLTRITNSDQDDAHPTWSSDGLKIAFSRDGEIWSVNADGTGEKQVTFDSIENYLEPAWSPDGKKIAFTKSLYSDEVAVINADGGDVVVVTRSGADFLPAWSQQTNQLIFVTDRDEATRAMRIVNSNGNSESDYISNEDIWWDSEPDVSPVNDNIAFQSTRNGAWNIWVKTQLEITDVAASPEGISPNGDGVNDTTEMTFILMGGSAKVSLNVYDASENLVRTLLDQELVPAGENRMTWDGSDGENVVSDGTYTFRITVAGSAGADPIEASATVIVDTVSPTFGNWIIPDITHGPQDISVTVSDTSAVNVEATRVQFGISSDPNKDMPDLIGWTDFGTGLSGTLEMNWLDFDEKHLYLRGYAEDAQGNAAYSDEQKKQIAAAPCDAVAVFTVTVDQADATFDTTGSVSDLSFNYGDGTIGSEASYRYAAVGNYQVTLTATDTVNECTAMSSLSVNIAQIPDNQPPIADAGPDQTANLGDTVTLDGSASSDPDPDDEITYLWFQTDGTQMTLSDPATVQPEFTADVAGEPLKFSLTVTDKLGLSDDDEMTVNVNQPPVAVALGPNRSLYEGGTVTLDASGSSDPDVDDVLTYQWAQTGGTDVTISDPAAVQPEFIAPEIGSDSESLTFRLEVRDGNNASDTAEVTVKIRELRNYHSADYNLPDHKIKLSELLRVIQFYNIKASYSCDPDGKDGYGFGEDDMTCGLHSSDYTKADQSREDRRINLSELLRIIQFYNSSGYHTDPNGEDGFAPDK